MKKIVLIIISFIVLITIIVTGIFIYRNTNSNKKTLFIYMCGSNLETKQGLASKNIDELLTANVGDNINIVIETGGAKTWRSHDIDNNSLQRYEIKDGNLILLDTLDNSNMGNEETLTDFLKWGLENYKTNHNMLILWDHGAGPTKGMCFDENYNFDGLSLPEIRTAFENANLKNKFDIIGLDACLMGSIETATYIQDFANYMIASEEIEPSGGWNYKELSEAYATNSDLLEVGKIVCDTYMEKCTVNKKDYFATLSVFDLSYTNEMLEQFDYAIDIINSSIKDKNTSSEIIHALNVSEKFGAENLNQGKTNMLDLIDIFNHTPDIDYDTSIISETRNRLVPYYVRGENRLAYGLSFYYPLLYNSEEISKYNELAFSDNYHKFLEDFYLNVPNKTIEFDDKGSKNNDGIFQVSLTENSSSYLSSIDYTVTTTDETGKKHIVLEDNNLTIDQDTLTYQSNFKGTCYSIEGHTMYSKATTRSEDSASFSTPVILNGSHTTLVFDFIHSYEDDIDDYYLIMGTWNDYDENGLPNNRIIPLQKGDKIQVLENYTIDGEKTIENFSDEFTLDNDNPQIKEVPLDKKEYQYYFTATDLFGNTITSDIATFYQNI